MGLRRPSLGVVATSFDAADVFLMEKVIQKFPNICGGVLVEKVYYTVYTFYVSSHTTYLPAYISCF